MPNTTNFNWSTPADTDLVKNGASAIRTLGSAIDTSFVDLKGGTTGQVLKKTSATDLDFEWGTASSGLTLINTTSFSAVASQSVNDVFSATYNNYRIITNLIGSTTLESVNFRFRVAGADNSSTNYRQQRILAEATSVSAARTTGATSWGSANGNVSSGSYTLNILELTNPFNAFNPSGFGFSNHTITGNITYQTTTFGLDVTTSYTGFTMLTSGGTMTGSVSVFGYSV